MNFSNLTAVSPIDGRYYSKTHQLAHYFSEYGLIRYRVKVEVLYFIALCELPLPQLKSFDKSRYAALKEIYTNFSEADAQAIKDIEKITNHDVKAVEYFIKKKFKELGIEQYQEFIHFGLTSQDINNTAIPCSLQDAMNDLVLELFDRLESALRNLSNQWADIPMLARTHGQPASPTRLGKEIQVFFYRLEKQTQQLKSHTFYGKFGGATGNFNAHHVAYPRIDWQDFANTFLQSSLGIQRNQVTTQIDNYDELAAFFHIFKRINTILIDFSRDIWQYISLGYFKQKINTNEVGSSAMPHKVNPIDFENAEGNFGIANAVFGHLSDKLPISRLQRDLTDSTVLRNIGVPLAHTHIAVQSLLKGIAKLELNAPAIRQDLENNWAVVAEAIQTVLRRENYPEPYEALKALTRTNHSITEKSIHEFIECLDVSQEVKHELQQITPYSYVGM